MNWTPDGTNIVYRNRISDGFSGKLYTVNKEGGLSEVIPLPEGGFCSYSPDGKRLAYNRVMREFRTWKYYKGGMADDVWIYDPENNQSKISVIIRRRILSPCGSAMKYFIFPIATVL